MFKARKEKVHSRQRKQEELREKGVHQYGVFPEGESQSVKGME